MAIRETPQAGGFLARSGPAEIILGILQCCETTQDLLALISTCRHVYDVWRANVSAAIWPVWLCEFPHFQDAVTAARMTQLVVDAERQSELPPTGFSPRQLQRPHQPTLSELRAAFALHRLSRAIAASICKADLPWVPSDRDHPRCHEPEEPGRMREWTARVSQTVFRVLTLGAALAGAYKEPLLKAKENPDPEIRSLAERVPREYSEGKGRHSLNGKELAILTQSAVCDLEATSEALDDVFGPVAEWLLESILDDGESRQAMAKRFEQGYGRAGCCRALEEGEECPVGLADGSGSHSDAHLVVWELMKILWVTEKLGGSFIQRRPFDQPSSESAVAVFFGMFVAEEVMLPTPTTSPSAALLAHPAKLETKEQDCGGRKLHRGMSVTVYLDYIFDHSEQPNHIEDTHAPIAPLQLQFFVYFLQRYLGLCFHEGAFAFEWPRKLLYRPFEEFMECITIFSHDDVEGRCPLDSDVLGDADFLDGSEILTKYPQDSGRFYQPRMW